MEEKICAVKLDSKLYAQKKEKSFLTIVYQKKNSARLLDVSSRDAVFLPQPPTSMIILGAVEIKVRFATVETHKKWNEFECHRRPIPPLLLHAPVAHDPARIARSPSMSPTMMSNMSPEMHCSR